jgi:DNA-binding winged helix-turn-helix (wHTH) protein/TolB-like protein/tetratricopeptide (TPR) repeat protein
VTAQPKHFYEFGPFRLEPSERLLLRDGQAVPLTPKVFDLLLVLVRNSGHLVDRETLMKEVWPDSFVEDANLTVNVNVLRKALGESPGDLQYIDTVPRRGYRFVSRVRICADDDGVVAEAEPVEPTAVPDKPLNVIDDEKPKLRLTRKTTVGLAAFVLLAVAVIVAGFLWRPGKPKQPADVQSIRSIAVLPFLPLAAESRDEPFELGMADNLITRLSAIKEIIVRPVSAIRKYNSPDRDPCAAGREQKVDAVLDAHIQRLPDRIRVTARLLRVADGMTLWPYQCDEKCTDIFEVQDSISEDMVRAIQVTITGEERTLLDKHHTNSPGAFEAYMKGRYFNDKRTQEAARTSIKYSERAVELDPKYSLAYAGLATSYASLSFLGGTAPEEVMPRAKQAALQALKLDDALGEAHNSLATIELYYDWDWADAEDQVNRALQLSPHNADAHLTYSSYLQAMGRVEKSIEEARLAHELNPMSLFTERDLGRAFYFARNYDEAIRDWRETLEMAPDFVTVYNWLSWVYEQKKMYQQSIEMDLKFKELEGTDPTTLGALRRAYEASGWRSYWRKALPVEKDFRERGRLKHWSFVIAQVHARLGEADQAFEWLNKAFDDRCVSLIWLKVDPTFDSLRSDPRFVGLLRRMNLPL